jgi:hypothetical protein
MEDRLRAAQAELAELRATKTWRAHERLAPTLGRIARRFSRT